MSIRVPMPSRREIQSLTGLIQAIKFHMNVASNQIITDDSALGYINLTEDIDLTALKLISMKKTEFVTVDSKGRFRLSNLKHPMTEMIGVFYQFRDLYQQNEYLQYVDPVSFGRGYGTVYTNALYTIDVSDDGSNDPILKVYPAPPSACLGIAYYSDWPKLGDLTTNSTRQQMEITFSGTAAAASEMQIATTILGEQTPYMTVNIAAGDTAQKIAEKIIQKNTVPFRARGGNNYSFWGCAPSDNVNAVIFSSPEYISDTAFINITNVPPGITTGSATLRDPFVQTVQTNWFLYNYPYVYYYGALKHAYNAIEDSERLVLVEREYSKAVAVLQAHNDRAEWAGSGTQSDYNQNVIW